MKSKILLLLLFLVFSFLGFQVESPHIKPSANKCKIMDASIRIKEYHSGSECANNVVKVVYFHGKDLDPLPNWKERLSRTLDDVSAYYKDEFKRFGIENNGIPFEKRNGKHVFYVVKGDLASRKYTKDSGNEILKEINAKTKGQIDFSKDHVLIINGLCYQKKDGTYVFHSPYYGSGSSHSGICNVADCELLDSKLLTSTQRMVFSEMTVYRKECNVSEFNSWYIGGIAHEMGHMFGLHHDFGNPLELDDSTISLMGEYGSRHYRDYLWNGQKSSIFSSASILQLISHPIFTQSNKGRYETPDISGLKLEIEHNTTGFVLKPTITQTDLKPYGIVALMRPSNSSEYYNKSFFRVVTADDSLQIELGEWPKGNYPLRVLLLYPNGAVPAINLFVEIDDKGTATLQYSQSSTVDPKKLYEKLQSMEKTPEVQIKLEILYDILNPVTPVDPANCDSNKLYLSDAKWEKASVGWEHVARNYYTSESEATFFLENKGKLYKKGLYAHSPSLYSFNLDKRWEKFSAIVGLRDYAHSEGSAQFTIIGDGKVLYKSPALRVNQQSIVSINIENIQVLELKAEGTEGHNHNSWAVWLDPLIEK